ncbi:DNA-directed RNA polymerase specialized sigma subunit sigma24-like protein [Paramagnetospirillum magnetotacticum MS-1]|uniref:RNA polymerase sigma factor n=2 Tax=Paramagnetospirillum magnetotacticum TaxID=188 RepID=A0A0C2UFY0_PARME|nr:DNA-directed RNA polymerase specialized sigma subunit sigma24-like protein [Paramagnetospirillum magnetotacticum MS-1]
MTHMDLAAYRTDLRRFVLRLTGNADLADDIVQDTLVRALTSSAGFSGRAKPLTWLSAIALNVLRDHYRRPATRTETELDEDALTALPGEGEDADMVLMQGEMGACITTHIMALPERLRDVLILHDMAEADHAEVALALGISEGNARVLLHRARIALRGRLAGQCRLDFGRDAIPCTPRDGGAP